jgi:hypothetical protein
VSNSKQNSRQNQYKQLAIRLSNFYKQYDPYDYADIVEDEQQALKDLTANLSDKEQRQDLIQWFTDTLTDNSLDNDPKLQTEAQSIYTELTNITRHETEQTIFDTIDSCKDKTVSAMQEMKTGEQLTDSIIDTMIQQRTAELNYTDGNGGLYI